MDAVGSSPAAEDPTIAVGTVIAPASAPAPSTTMGTGTGTVSSRLPLGVDEAAAIPAATGSSLLPLEVYEAKAGTPGAVAAAIPVATGSSLLPLEVAATPNEAAPGAGDLTSSTVQFEQWWGVDKAAALTRVFDRVSAQISGTGKLALDYIEHIRVNASMPPVAISRLPEVVAHWEDRWRSVPGGGGGTSHQLALLKFLLDVINRMGVQWQKAVSSGDMTESDEMAAVRSGVLSLLRLAEHLSSGPHAAEWLKMEYDRALTESKPLEYMSCEVGDGSSKSLWSYVGGLATMLDRDGQCTSKSAEAKRTCNTIYLMAMRSMRTTMERMLSADDEGKSSKGSSRSSRSIGDLVGLQQQRSSGVTMHDSRTHLFGPDTYRDMREELSSFVALAPGLKPSRMALLRARLRYRALLEVFSCLVRVAETAGQLLELLQDHLRAQKTRSVDALTRGALALLEDVEWDCRLTWQQRFVHDDDADRRQWLQAGSGLGDAGGKEDMAPVQGQQQQGGGGGDGGGEEENGDGDGDDPDVEVISSNIGRTNYHARNQVRQALSLAKSTVAQAQYMAAQLGNTDARASLFARRCLAPRLEAVLLALCSGVRPYLVQKQVMEHQDLAKEERARMAEMIGGGKLPLWVTFKHNLLLDTVQLMYALKLLRFMGQVVAMRIATHHYAELFRQAVYVREGGDRAEPPSLLLMLYAFLGIDAMMQLATLLCLVVVAQMLAHTQKEQPPSSKRFRGRGIIDDELIMLFLLEYFVSTVATVVLGCLIGTLVRRKKYFDLLSQGSKTIEAYGWMLVAVCAAVGIIPFFLVL